MSSANATEVEKTPYQNSKDHAKEQKNNEAENLMKNSFLMNLVEGENKTEEFKQKLLKRVNGNDFTGGMKPSLKEQETDELNLDVLGFSDYYDYTRNLEKSRQEVKKRWAQASDNLKRAQDDLIRAYKELLTLRELTKTHDTGLIYKAERETLYEESKVYMMKIFEKIDTAMEAYKLADTEMEQEDRTFTLFQQDQGRVMATVEKHKVFGIRQARSSKRNSAHNAIVSALKNSPGMLNLAENERTTYLSEVCTLLTQLEDVEGETDELVQRLELKVSAIQLSEAQQNSEIEQSLANQETINDQLDVTMNKILENNTLLKKAQDTFQSEVAQKIDEMVRPSSLENFVILCVGLLVLFGIVCALYWVFNTFA